MMRPERELFMPRPWWERAGRMVLGGILAGRGGAMGGLRPGLVKRLKARLAPAMLAPAGSGVPQHKAVVCLTHDLDWVECWRALEKVVEMELEAGVRSTIFVLTRGPYRISRSMLEDLRQEGFEIALHGLWHDPALGMRPPGVISQFLLRAMDELGMEVMGFRAPALSFSPRLVLALARAGFAYDSSLAGWWKAVGRGPWVWKGLGVIELPVWAGDDRLLRERGIEPHQAARVLVEAAARGSWAAPAVVNLHPGLSMAFRGFFSEFLYGLVRCGARVVGAAEALGLGGVGARGGGGR